MEHHRTPRPGTGRRTPTEEGRRTKRERTKRRESLPTLGRPDVRYKYTELVVRGSRREGDPKEWTRTPKSKEEIERLSIGFTLRSGFNTSTEDLSRWTYAKEFKVSRV